MLARVRRPHKGTHTSENAVYGVLQHKKFELMLTKRVKAYSSSRSQTVSLSPAISSQFILECALQLKIAKINKNSLFWKLRVFQSHQCWYDWKARH